MASSWAGFTAILAATTSGFALGAAKPIAPRAELNPKVEIDYANITGRVNGNIKEFLGMFKQTMSGRAGLFGCITNIYKASPSPQPVASSTRSSTLSSWAISMAAATGQSARRSRRGLFCP